MKHQGPVVDLALAHVEFPIELYPADDEPKFVERRNRRIPQPADGDLCLAVQCKCKEKKP